MRALTTFLALLLLFQPIAFAEKRNRQFFEPAEASKFDEYPEWPTRAYTLHFEEYRFSMPNIRLYLVKSNPCRLKFRIYVPGVFGNTYKPPEKSDMVFVNSKKQRIVIPVVSTFEPILAGYNDWLTGQAKATNLYQGYIKGEITIEQAKVLFNGDAVDIKLTDQYIFQLKKKEAESIAKGLATL